jgi:hypothetical protein
MVNEQLTIIAAIVASTFTILASIIASLTILYRGIGRLEGRVSSLENRVARLEERINVIERRMDAFMLFGGSLLGVLTGRNLIDIPSAGFLASVLSFGVGGGRSKYYT